LQLVSYIISRALSKKIPSVRPPKYGKGGSFEATNIGKETRTVYEMISYLSGKPIPGCDPNVALPSDPTIRAKQIYVQHAALLNFVRFVFVSDIYWIYFVGLKLTESKLLHIGQKLIEFYYLYCSIIEENRPVFCVPLLCEWLRVT